MVEREIKIACQENPLTRVPELELELVDSRHFEDNVLLDLDDRRLSLADRVLRLRMVDQQGWLTYKSAPHEHSWLKVRDEIQVALNDPQTMLALFEAIGFNPVFRYQKFRTHYRVRSPSGRRVEAVYDETPMGNFLELEGDAEAISEVVERLKIPSQDLIQASYPDLWVEWLKLRGEPRRDMVFSDNQPKENRDKQCER